MNTPKRPINAQFVSAMLMLVAAVIFAVVGFRSLPRNNTYIILGIVFAILAANRFRRARMSP